MAVFARAVRPEKAEDLAGTHLQIETDERDFGCLPKLMAGEFDAQFFSFKNDAHDVYGLKGCFVN